MVVDGESDDFGAEKLKGLLKILPEQDEVRSIYDLCSSTFIYSNSNYRKGEMLKSWDGDRAKLGNAERFILQLTEVKK